MIATGFDLEAGRGRFYTLALRGEVAPLPWLSFGGRAPLHWLHVDGADAVSGPGDLDLALKVRLIAGERLTLSAGLAAELPTGDEHAGIGSGHLELAPHVSALAVFGDLLLHGSAADSVSLGEDDHEHVNFVSPHADHELRYHLGVAHPLHEQLVGNLVVSGATILSAEDRGDTLLVAAPQLAWAVTPRTALLATAELPLTSARRLDWRAAGSVQVSF